jgi:dCTP deaminase
MTVLADWQIRARCEAGMVVPFNPDLVNPASLDVRLGPRIQVEQIFTRKLRTIDISYTTPERPYLIWPLQWLLAETVESFCLSDNIAAQFKLKSSRAREGIDHALAGFADPGWFGSKLTMELRNNRLLHRVPIWCGMRIGQMKFEFMDALPTRSYALTGRYNNDTTVQESKG